MDRGNPGTHLQTKKRVLHTVLTTNTEQMFRGVYLFLTTVLIKFATLVTKGGLGNESKTFNKRLVSLLTSKWNP